MECHAEPVGLESHANIDLSQWVLHRAERGRDRTRLSRDTQHAASHDKLQPVHWQAKASNQTLGSPCHHSKSTSSIPSEISDTPVRDTVMSIQVIINTWLDTWPHAWRFVSGTNLNRWHHWQRHRVHPVMLLCTRASSPVALKTEDRTALQRVARSAPDLERALQRACG